MSNRAKQHTPIQHIFGAGKAAQTMAKRGNRSKIGKLPTSLDELKQFMDVSHETTTNANRNNK